MPVSWRIADDIVLLESDEQATLAEWKAAIGAALARSDQSCMGLLHDARRKARVPSPEETRMRASFLGAQARAHSVARWAVVVASRAQYGMGRMAEALTENDRSVEFRVFTDLAEAEAWLREGFQTR